MRRRNSQPQSQNETKIRTPSRSKMRREIVSEEQEEPRGCDTSKIASEGFELANAGRDGNAKAGNLRTQQGTGTSELKR
ncbi:unnamed protein product [Sphagnum balticum]